jgi:hypothetical protein
MVNAYAEFQEEHMAVPVIEGKTANDPQVQKILIALKLTDAGW